MESTSSRPEKNQRVSNVTIAIILGLAAATVAFAYFLSDRGPTGAQNTQGKIGEDTVDEKSAAASPTIASATTEDIDTWLASEIKSTNASIAVMNVWATWCEPCRTEMPELAEFQKQHPEWPLLLVSADNENDIEEARKFLQVSKVEKPSRLIRGDQSVFIEDWRKRSSADPLKQWSMSLPVTFFVDQNGKVLKFIAGGTTRQELVAIAEGLMRELPAGKPSAPNAL